MTVASHGDQGKPRPALVVQADLFDGLGFGDRSSNHRHACRRSPSPCDGRSNGAKRIGEASQVMVEKPQTPASSRLGNIVGHLKDPIMITVNRLLAVFLGLA